MVSLSLSSFLSLLRCAPVREDATPWQMGRQWDSPPPPPHGYLPGCRGDGRCSDGAVRLQLPLRAGD
eukprot:scaffold20662_cov101-Isochrysis_galbana.AAC.3